MSIKNVLLSVRRLAPASAIVIGGLFVGGAFASCPNITPLFSYSKSTACAVPVNITLSNNSTGLSRNVAIYSWYLNYKLLRRDTGLKNLGFLIKSVGVHRITLIVRDTGSSGCTDSASRMDTISRTLPRIMDGLGTYTYNPVFENCISTPGTPDTFGIQLQAEDTLRNYTIRWGDGQSASGSLLAKGSSLYHKYNSLSLFNLLIISNRGGCRDTIHGLVVNERKPVAGIIGPPTGTNEGCVPLRVRFINNSLNSSPSTRFDWDMGDGTKYAFGSSTFKDTLYHTYRKQLCNGIVTLKATNNCGSSTTTWSPIQAGERDSAIISAQNPDNCDTAKPFRFDNKSISRWCGTPNPRKFKWVWGDGSSSGWTTTPVSATKKYALRGSYNIMLIDSNSCGKDTARFILKIDSLPAIKTSVSTNYGCPPLVVNFDDKTAGSGLTRIWDFGEPYTLAGVNVSNKKSPTYTYANAGVWKAVLKVSNKCGTVNDTQVIVVRKKVKAAFVPFTRIACVPYTHDFVNSSTEANVSGTTYKWIWEDSSVSTLKNPGKRTFTKAGSYKITLIANDSCGSDTFSVYLAVMDKPKASLAADAGCEKNSLKLTLKSDPVSAVYVNFGDGSAELKAVYSGATYNLYKTYDSAKTYNAAIRVFGATGCSDTFYTNIVIHPLPSMAFTKSASEGCAPLTVAFSSKSLNMVNGTSSGMQYKWKFGNGDTCSGVNDTACFGASKTKDTVYSVKLIGTNTFGCKDSTVSTIRVFPKPLSRFSTGNQAGCGPLLLQTVNTSIPHDTGSIRIMSFKWNFGNGIISQALDTQLVYPASLTKDTSFKIELIAASEHGCLDTSSSLISVYPKPLAYFTASAYEGCSPGRSNFMNLSKPYDTGSVYIMKFRWDFGDGQVSNLLHPSVVYTQKLNKDSVFNITLVAESEHGCKDTFRRKFNLHPLPELRLKNLTASGCSPLKVAFENESLNGEKFSWKFGSLQTDTAKNPVRIFYGRVIYDSIIPVWLSAQSKWGCQSDTLKTYVTVKGRPEAAFLQSKDSFCYMDQIQFLNQTLGAIAYQWNFGNGQNSSLTNPRLMFAKSTNPFADTTYKVSLVARGLNTCTDSAEGVVKVLPYPISKFTGSVYSGCAPLQVSFNNQSVNHGRLIWNFGDGETSTQWNPVHTFFNFSGRDTQYRVTLFTYYHDCVDTLSSIVTVAGRPFAMFKANRSDDCDRGLFNFKNVSVGAVTQIWNFGDEQFSADTNPSHWFTTSGYRDTSYRVQLIVRNDRGCADTFDRLVVLPQRLQVKLKDTNYRLCAPGVVKFVNFSSGAKIYFWNFGDYQSSVDRNPEHTYSKPGRYRYALFAYDANGCLDSVVANGEIRVLESPVAGFTYSPTELRMPKNNAVQFTDRSISTVPLNYRWDFGDTGTLIAQSEVANPMFEYSDSGNFSVRLIVDNGSCADTAYKTLRVEPAYPLPAFNSSVDSGCQSLQVQFKNESRYANRFTWYFGDGDKSNEANPVHIYKQSGIFDVKLIAEGPGGVESVLMKRRVVVFEKPFASFMAGPGVAYLPNAFVQTKNNSAGADAYHWHIFNNKGSSQESSLFEPRFKLSDTGRFRIVLVAMNEKGCSDTMEQKNVVFVNPEGFIYIPNAYTPNGDELNDLFKPVSVNLLDGGYSFSIYSRWGELLYLTHEKEAGWDGQYGGNLCQSGVYVYKVNGRLITGEDVALEGVVHLMR